MDRVIRSKSKQNGGVWYLCEWSRLVPGCALTPSWTRKQRDAKRYPHRGAAREDLARVIERDSFMGDEDELGIAKLVGTHALARRLVAATRLAKELRERKGAPLRARAASERVVEDTFVELADAVDRLDNEREARARARREKRG